MLNNLLNAEKVYFSDTFEPFAIWGTVVIFALCILAFTLTFFIKREKAGILAKKLTIGFIVYALLLGILLLVLEILKKYDLGYLENNWVSKDIIIYVFIPLLVTAIFGLISFLSLLVISKKQPFNFKKFSILFGLIFLFLVIATVILIYIYYSKNIVGDGYYTDEEYGNLNNLALYLSSALLIVVSIALAFLIGKKDDQPFDTKCIALAGVCVSLSFALSYVKLFELPYGGSITLFSMLPIMLFSYIYGIKKGLIVGVLYGILQAIQDPFIVHPAQFLLDYPLAFAMMGYAGCLTHFNILSNKPRLKFILSCIVAGSMRWVCHVFSGVFAFGAYALDGASKLEGIFAILAPFASTTANFWIYSVFYNLYVYVDLILVIIGGIILFSSKGFIKEVEKISPSRYINK